jgi:hypothetical protein
MKNYYGYALRAVWIRILVFVAGSLSILSLLSYFLGIYSFLRGATWLLIIEIFCLSALCLSTNRHGKDQVRDLLLSGLWAGALATLAYDVVRIPVAHSGIPVFKAISYFGTVLLGVQSPTPLSEVLGWAYHLSNGVSFGLMYVALVR